VVLLRGGRHLLEEEEAAEAKESEDGSVPEAHAFFSCCQNFSFLLIQSATAAAAAAVAAAVLVAVAVAVVQRQQQQVR